jgi:hypothetical protein
MKEPTAETADSKRATPLDSYLTYKFSGIDLTDSIATRPVCSKCDGVGEENDRLLFDEGEAVYACALWEDCLGWDLFGVYHTDHEISEIAAPDPPQPVAILQGDIRRTENEVYDESRPAAYTLTKLSVVSVNYPGTLGY